MLVAFVDGELDAEESLAIHIALRHDPALRERVRVMRESAALLRAAYGDVAREPVPPGLTGAIGRQRTTHRRWLPAAAAAVALAVGLSAGSLAPWSRRTGPASEVASTSGATSSGSNATADDPLALLTPNGTPQSVLHRTLERERSGTSIAWTDPDTRSEVTVEPLRTFRAADRTFCREYRETVAMPRASPHTGYGLACRTPEGRWNVQYMLLPGAQPTPFEP
jgi:surface antigen